MSERFITRESFYLLDLFPHGVLVIDSGYQVIYWNATLEDWTKIGRNEILNTDIRDWYSQFRNPKVIKRMEEVFRGAPPTLFSSKLHRNTIPCFSSSQKPVLQQTIVTAIPSKKEGEFAALFTIQDITDEHSKTAKIRSINKQLEHEIEERKRAEKELIKAKLDAEEANKSKTEFLSRMSHELRTPLNAILGFSQLLLRDSAGDDSKNTSHLNHILHAGQHLLELINEILDLSHVESGNLNLEIFPNALHSLVKETVNLLTPLAEEKKIKLDCFFENTGELYANVDRIRFKQVMINLISNAIKYNKPGGRVHISGARTKQNMIQIRVEDTGRGISEKNLQVLFEPFTRFGENSGTIEGTGIGLTISKKLIHLMDGDISVESVLGQGTIVTLTLAPSHSLALSGKPRSNFLRP